MSTSHISSYRSLSLSLCTDLGKKQFDYFNKFTVKRATANGLKVETSVTSADDLSANVKLSYTEKGLGAFEASEDTSGVLKTKAKFTDLHPGATVTVEPSFNGLLTVKSTAEYSQENFAVAATLQVKESKVEDETTKKKVSQYTPTSSIAAVLGFDGISIGGKLSVADKKFSEPDVNLGFNFAENDFQFSVVTETAEKKGHSVSAKLFHQVNSDLQSGFAFASPANTVTFSNQYNLDKSTVLKSSVSTTGKFQASVQNTSKFGRFNLAAQFQSANGRSFKSEKYGLSYTVGDL